ncbi:AAA family ATPase [Cellulomonas dongxiuzhuiae]|uniref:AAA family ATPase n=1 Tax=Cellulomonas dongxiuzhuiae TaxID=2819979 RepID=A0ABX8GHC5_9CELL|nr:AAA family ATPase [Cellulomonas dongxiuzhuiae]MBO3088128.1 AAA family ATPase [Cellulomonas dongxiuzhuiae]MBO3094525.1 AAA family ATPase [Cellulomonas dongxiuzhuiae]QWC15548.1 AAA family ATPase [Cellulomonas dongxiuzhuiae]
MRNSELARVLRAANPWWSRRRRATWVLDDDDLAARARHEWAPATACARAALAPLADGPRPATVTLVVGPRGVGKTTAVKDVVAHLVADPATDPRRVVLIPAQLTDATGTLDDLEPADLATAVRTPTRTGAPACDGPRVLVVDEVGAVAGWPRVLADAARRGDQVVATTSVLDPADLAELEAACPAGSLTVRRLQPASLSELLGACPTAAVGDVRAAYLRHGGLPRAVAEHRDLGDVSPELVASLAAGLHRDVCRGVDGCPLDLLLSGVCATTDRFVEPEPLARLLGLSTAEVGRLLARLEHAHVLDPRRGLVDPLLHRLPSLIAPERHVPPTAQHIATFSH